MASSANSTTTTTTTVLRVKRPRHVAPLEALCVNLEANKKRKSSEIQNLTQLMHTSSYISAQQSRETRVVWKRVEPDSNNKRIRYVDARIDNADSDGEQPQTKKRRLALTLLRDEVDEKHKPAPSTPTKSNIILDPQSRLVDDSLKQVFKGSHTLSQHYDFIENDSRLASNKNWWSWCTRPGGNALHAAALYNDIERAQKILTRETEMLMALDGDGRTPYEVATMVGHDGLAKVLEAYMEETITKEEEGDFVYDFFGIQQEEMKEDDKDDDDDMLTPTAELRGGIGYWNDQGELVLEALQDEQMMDNDSVRLDDDVDSNCEDYEGNDYPDEENNLWQDMNDDESSSDEEDATTNYRNRPVMLGSSVPLGIQRDGKVGVMMQCTTKQQQHDTYIYNDDEDDDEYYENIVSQYDHYESNPQPERLYAYDPELDDNDNHYSD